MRLAYIAPAYRGRRVLVTGHTGFKGAWLTLLLSELGAEVTGLALPALEPSLYRDANVAERCRGIEGDVRDGAAVDRALRDADADVVFHLAAQSLVRAAHRDPQGTFATNVLGTANVLEAVRAAGRPRAVVVVTSDKCYDPRAGTTPRTEDDPLGGEEPYSASKAACEHVVAAYRASFFPPETLTRHGVALATARAGNVIGGGDQAADRIVPDAIRALTAGRPVPVRNPGHVRPWQHVLEPVGGYLLLGARLLGESAPAHCEAWNFGPLAEGDRSVRDLVEGVIRHWGTGTWETVVERDAPREVPVLRLSVEKAERRLSWRPQWELERTVDRTVRWYRARADGASAADLARLCREQIAEYFSMPVAA